MSSPELFVTFVVIGLLLITVEIFIPGGVLGILGAIALTAALITGFYAFGLHGGFIAAASIVVFGGGVIFLWLRYFPRTFMGKGITLGASMKSAKSSPNDEQTWNGKTGTALSDLRPAGVADIDGQRADVVAESGYIPNGAPIRVVAVEGIRIVVREIR